MCYFKKSILRRFAALLIIFAASFTLLLAGQAPTAEAATTTPHANVVVILRFSDDTSAAYNNAYQYNSSYTNWQILESRFNTTGNTYLDQNRQSLQSYISTVSNGAYEVTSYFPQNKADGTNTMVYITLPRTQAEYESLGSGDYYLLEDAIASLNNDFLAQVSPTWDSDNDGIIDNVDFIVQTSSEASDASSFLWSHKSNYQGISKIGSYSINTYNLMSSASIENSLGVIQHEYLHSVGLGDLYRTQDYTSIDGPVGTWDIMAQASWNYPLAQNRQDLGWTTIHKVDESGTYTLYAPYSQSGAQAVKVSSPLSSDDYFVFEYRQKGTYVGDVDQGIAASGLIAYRVNPDTDLDISGHHTNRLLDQSGAYYQDYLYVFRPGETGLHDSGGSTYEAMLTASDTNYAYTGKTYGQRDSLGIDRSTAANEAKDITDGAIVGSDGSNTGITVQVTGQTADSITFTLTMPTGESVDTWEEVGTPITTDTLNTIQYSDTTTDDSGNIYQAYWTANADSDSDSSLRVRMFNGSAWNNLGDVVASGRISDPQLDFVDGTLCCTYLFYGSSEGIASMKYENGRWSQAAKTTLASTPNSLSVVTSGNSLYAIVATENTSGYSGNLQLYRSGQNQFDSIGSPVTLTYATDPTLVIMNEVPYLITGDYAEINHGTAQGQVVYAYKNGSWSLLADDSVSGFDSKINAAISAENQIVTYAGYEGTNATPAVKTVDPQGNITLHSLDDIATSTSEVSLLYRNGYIYIAVTNQEKALAVYYSSINDLDSWTQLGLNATSSAWAPSICTNGQSIFIGYIKSSSTEAGVAYHSLVQADPKTELIDIANCAVAAIPDQTYTASDIEPEPSVTCNGAALVKGTDYTLSYSSNRAVGTATVLITGKGNFTGSVETTFRIVSSGDPAADFVERLYVQCLGRASDAGGKANWMGHLRDGSTGADVAYGFLFSQEFREANYCNEHYVRKLYAALFDREADSGGYDNWMGLLEDGWTREAVFNGFVNSDEFTALCARYGIARGSGVALPEYGTVPTGPCRTCGLAAPVTQFVTRLYSTCLDRDPDPEGLAHWCGALWDHTNTGTATAYGFFFSQEFTGKGYGDAAYVTHLYNGIFGRDPDPQGYANWIAHLRSGMSRADVFYGFANSEEFTAMCNRYGISKG